MLRILLIQPPIYDFAAYDFWLRPYGVLRVAGALRGQAEMELFDYLDRSAFEAATPPLRTDAFGRGELPAAPAAKPSALADVKRRFRRFGRAREHLRAFLAQRPAFDFALVQTMMTYWYGGVAEVIADLRRFSPRTRIVLGGVYATLCPGHAATLGADLVVPGLELGELWRLLGLRPDFAQPALWEATAGSRVGAIRLTHGCPQRCSYCSVPGVYGPWQVLPPAHATAELELLAHCGATDVAFYDDAILHRPQEVLLGFLDAAQRIAPGIRFHTPNALNARFLNRELAGRLVAAGVRTFYLGFESASPAWQRRTGGKVAGEELAEAVANLTAAGADLADVTAYVILGHPDSELQDVEAAMRFAHGLGVRVMLADFSPIPGTADGEACRRWVDLDEPLNHNNTAFTRRRMGEEGQRLKGLCRELNRRRA